MQPLIADPARAPWKKRASGYGAGFRLLIAALFVALGYYLGARIGFALTFRPHPVSTLWPPNSILLAALLLAPKRWWWILLLAALPAHVIVELNSGVPLPMIICWFISNGCEALIAALFIRSLTNGPIRFDTSQRVAIFMLAAVLAPFLSSFLDAGFVIVNHWGGGSYWQIWRMRFFSNVLAELTLVPFIAMWISEGFSFLRHWTPSRYLEAAALLVGLLVISVLVLSGNVGPSPTPALLYTPLPLLLWAAVRFGPKGISTALVAVTFVSTWGAINGLGPFVNRSPEENALSAQLFLILISLPLLTLGAVIEEQKRLRRVARKNEEQLELALNAARMGTWDWHIADNETKWSDETKRIFGFLPTDSEVPPEVFYEMLHEEDRQGIRDAIDRAIQECGPYAAEFRMPQPDGSIRWVRGQGKVLVDEIGRPVRMVGVNTDITTRKLAEEQLRQRNRQIRALAGRLISAQESERRRIARELHDELSQKVAALSVAISHLKRKLPGMEKQIIDELDGLYGRTHELTGHIRQLSHQLHPAALEHLGLEKALAAYTVQFQQEEDIETNFISKLNGTTIPFATSVCFYRIAVEGLRNVAKHSEAKSASVFLKEDDKNLVLEITDLGRGFDVEQARRGSGLGLISAEERVEVLQGKLEISSDSKGTKLIAKVPLS
jgi:two-component system, LuxR family, sensor kinase FixL